MGGHQEPPSRRGQADRSVGGWLGEWANTIAEHHEKYDGSGYPYGLKGDEISLGGRIVAVADCYDTMTTVRSYKTAMSPKAARAELAACAGSQFDPRVVRAFLDVSIGRLRPVAGPLAWLGSLPFVGSIPQAVRPWRRSVGWVPPPSSSPERSRPGTLKATPHAAAGRLNPVRSRSGRHRADGAGTPTPGRTRRSVHPADTQRAPGVQGISRDHRRRRRSSPRLARPGRYWQLDGGGVDHTHRIPVHRTVDTDGGQVTIPGNGEVTVSWSAPRRRWQSRSPRTR